MEGHQVKDLQIARGGHQRAVEIVGHTVQEIHRAGVSAQGALDARLQALVLGLEDGLGLRGKHFLMRKRQVQGHQAAHLFPQLQNVLVGDMLSPELAVISAGKGVVNLENLLRKQVPRRPLRQKAQGTDVGAAAVRMVVADKLHVGRLVQFIIQGFQLVIHQGGQDRVLLSRLGIFDDGGSDGTQFLTHFSLRLRAKPPARAILTFSTSADVTSLWVII